MISRSTRRLALSALVATTLLTGAGAWILLQTPAEDAAPAPETGAAKAAEERAAGGEEGAPATASHERVVARPAPTETELMEQARQALGSDPERALSLIERADARFGQHDEARRKLEIRALVQQQRIGLSHSKAEAFYRSFPDSPARAEIERLTGYHPRPRGP